MRIGVEVAPCECTGTPSVQDCLLFLLYRPTSPCCLISYNASKDLREALGPGASKCIAKWGWRVW